MHITYLTLYPKTLIQTMKIISQVSSCKTFVMLVYGVGKFNMRQIDSFYKSKAKFLSVKVPWRKLQYVGEFKFYNKMAILKPCIVTRPPYNVQGKELLFLRIDSSDLPHWADIKRFLPGAPLGD
jgi:hypothetical protein